ncbi:hypothetical protein ACL1IP_10765, partial [Corynebacterium striatum]
MLLFFDGVGFGWFVFLLGLGFSRPDFLAFVLKIFCGEGPDPRKVDTSGVSYAAWVSVADVSASKSSGARRLHQECRLRV